jgi:hypothetical protein
MDGTKEGNDLFISGVNDPVSKNNESPKRLNLQQHHIQLAMVPGYEEVVQQ